MLDIQPFNKNVRETRSTEPMWHDEILSKYYSEDQGDTRHDLVKALRKGLRHKLSDGREIKLQSMIVTASTLLIVRIDFSHQGKDVGFVSVEISKDNVSLAENMKKFYNDGQGSEFSNKGLITLASGLMFQLLIQIGVDKVSGKILYSNERSQRTRLKTPDLVSGGYFKVGATFSPGELEQTFITYLNSPIDKPLAKPIPIEII